jgi:hypothetical protein
VVYFGADHTVELLCPIDPDNPVGVYTMVNDLRGQGLILVRSHAGGNVVEWVEEVIPP